jgi:hypothetical protein
MNAEEAKIIAQKGIIEADKRIRKNQVLLTFYLLSIPLGIHYYITTGIFWFLFLISVWIYLIAKRSLELRDWYRHKRDFEAAINMMDFADNYKEVMTRIIEEIRLVNDINTEKHKASNRLSNN